MSKWMPQDEFDQTEYGRLNKILAGKNYFGKLDKDKVLPWSVIVPDPKDGVFGIIKDAQGNPIGKIDLI